MRKLIFISTLIMFVVFSSNAYAASPKGNYTLKPAKETEKIFDKAEIIVDGEDSSVSLSEKIDADESVGSTHLSIEIDLKNKTYKVKKTKIKVEISPKALAANSLMATEGKYLYVTAITADPPGEDLARTTAKLWWGYTGSSTSKLATNKVCWGNPSTNFLTTWYLDSCYFSNNSSTDGGRTQTVGVSGYFHNYDWLYDSQITRTNHNVYIEGYSDGSSWYNITWGRSGESSSILHLDSLVQKGDM